MRNGTALCLAVGAVLGVACGLVAVAPLGAARADVIIPDPPKSKRVAVSIELDWGVLADRVSRAYVVAKGDTLSTIAQRMCGSAARWKAIADANPRVVHDTDRIDAGATLWLPPMRSFDPPAPASAAPDPKALLPWYDAFWMRPAGKWSEEVYSRASPPDAPERPRFNSVLLVDHSASAAFLAAVAAKQELPKTGSCHLRVGMSSLVHADEPTVRMHASYRITGIDGQLVKTEVKVTRYDAAGKVVEKVLPLEPSEWDRLPRTPEPEPKPKTPDTPAPVPPPEDAKSDLRDVPPDERVIETDGFRWNSVTGIAVALVGGLVVLAVALLRRRPSK